MDDFDTTGHPPLNLRAEQQKDSDIKIVILSFERGPPTTGQYLSTDLKKYLKQYPRLAMFDGVLHRTFYNHTGNSFIKQYCVPIHMRKEVFFRILPLRKKYFSAMADEQSIQLLAFNFASQTYAFKRLAH